MRALRSKTALLFCFTAGTLVAQQGSLVPLRAVDVANLRSRLKTTDLPEGAHSVKIDEKQSFHYAPAQAAKALDLLSVSFQVPEGAIRGLHCGVYLVLRDGSGLFFDPVSASLPIVCEDVAAVRLKRHGAQPPDFLITGDFTSGSRAWRQDFLISWDKLSGKYTLDSSGL